MVGHRELDACGNCDRKYQVLILLRWKTNRFLLFQRPNFASNAYAYNSWSAPVQSNENATGIYLERTKSAKITLAKIMQIAQNLPREEKEVSERIVCSSWSLRRAKRLPITRSPREGFEGPPGSNISAIPHHDLFVCFRIRKVRNNRTTKCRTLIRMPIPRFLDLPAATFHLILRRRIVRNRRHLRHRIRRPKILRSRLLEQRVAMPISPYQPIPRRL